MQACCGWLASRSYAACSTVHKVQSVLVLLHGLFSSGLQDNQDEWDSPGRGAARQRSPRQNRLKSFCVGLPRDPPCDMTHGRGSEMWRVALSRGIAGLQSFQGAE
ncbi:hypothetical protein F2P81_025791 [Scophthalmus maximus]|uniref:Uncharacterized protein n=1 Tax=Scophthalmus maximus TaxID=52904 RepID=A0A6A4RHK2_SCOMX|nr:hypothetical protein F2P81_025791 [Scophthalmus maximus]